MRNLMAKPSWTKALWAGALSVSFLLSVFAAFRGGYVGPDYWSHLPRLIERPSIFDYSLTNPPLYYILGHGLFRLIGSNNAFPITLSIIQAAINSLAMWFFFLYSERRFKSPVIHLALVFFLTFLPVRIIHVSSLGADCTTIPIFVLVLFLFDKFLSDKTSTPKNAAFLGLGLALGVWSKYTFVALLPAVFLIFIFCWWRRGWAFKRFVAICALSLVLPSGLTLHSVWASARVHGINTNRHWISKGMAPEMNYKDLFLPKAKDVELFRVPEYFRPPAYRAHVFRYSFEYDITVPHRYSYLGLVHLGIFTDTMNLFQDLSVPEHLDSTLNPDKKMRRAWKTPVMAASMLLGTLWTLLALIGVPWTLFAAAKNLWRDKLEREDVTALLGIFYFLVIFLPIAFVQYGYLGGYWTPRLILPALLYFFLAAFLLLDRKIAPRSGKIPFAVLILVIVQSGIEIVMLA